MLIYGAWEGRLPWALAVGTREAAIAAWGWSVSGGFMLSARGGGGGGAALYAPLGAGCRTRTQPWLVTARRPSLRGRYPAGSEACGQPCRGPCKYAGQGAAAGCAGPSPSLHPSHDTLAIPAPQPSLAYFSSHLLSYAIFCPMTSGPCPTPPLPQVLATIHRVESCRSDRSRNILHILSTNTRRTKVVELSSGTHRRA
jgi:hypothetical protein